MTASFFLVTHYVIVIFKTEWRNLITDAKNAVIVIYKIKMMEIERILNYAMALPNIDNGNWLRRNDDLCRHQIVILLEVVNDTAPCLRPKKVVGLL